MSGPASHAAPTPPRGSPDPGSIAPPPTPQAAAADRAHSRALGGAVRAVSGMTLLSRVGGLVRDVLIGRIFGDTAIGSAFAAAFAIPNMFRRLFGEGALSAAFIPEYTQATKEPSGNVPKGQAGGEADALASLTLIWLGLVTGGLTVVIEVLLFVLLLVLPHDPERALSLRLIMAMLPFMPLICITAILAGMLQVHGRFAASASGPLVLNGFIIAVGGYCLYTGTLASERVAYALGVATVLSGGTQAFWFARLLRRNIRWTRETGPAREAARRMLRRFIPVMIGLGTLQLNAFLDTLIAMWPIWVGATMLGAVYPLDDRSNIILSLTTRLYQFPLGVFGIAVATAAFPMLSRHANEPALFASTLRRGLRLSLFIGLPATVGLILVRVPITRVLFSGGKSGFSPDGLVRSAAVLAGFAPGIWAYSLNHVFTRAFYARGDTRTPMTVSIWMVGLNLALNLLLIWPLREAGLAVATSTSAVVQCVVLGILCHRRLGAAGVDRDTAIAFARIAIATVVMAAAVLGAQRLAPGLMGWTGALLRLGISCAVGIGAYLGAARALRGPELGWLFKRS